MRRTTTPIFTGNGSKSNYDIRLFIVSTTMYDFFIVLIHPDRNKWERTNLHSVVCIIRIDTVYEFKLLIRIRMSRSFCVHSLTKINTFTELSFGLSYCHKLGTENSVDLSTIINFKSNIPQVIILKE